MKLLAVIQARGGSKGVPRKNVRPMAGRPLIEYSIDAAKRCNTVERIIVSTDDEEIAEIARAEGAEVPFLRPAALATDTAKSIDTYIHLVRWLQEHEGAIPAAIIQLKPTNPLRTAADIEQAVAAYFEYEDIDSLLTVQPVSEHPYKMWIADGDMLVPLTPAGTDGFSEPYKMPRQALPPRYITNSAVNIISTRTILEQRSGVGSRIGYCVLDNPHAGINIDTLLDFKLAEVMLHER